MSLLQRFVGWIKALLLIGSFIFALCLLWGIVFMFSVLLFLSDRYIVLVPTVLTAPFGIVGTYWLLRRLTARRERTVIAVTVVLWLVIVLPVLAMPPQENGPQVDPDADFSGVISSDYPDENVQASHKVNLSANDTIRMEFDTETSGLFWSIQEPDGNSTGGPMKGKMPDRVRQTEDNDIIYTAPQDGTYQITLSAEPYSKIPYAIHIVEAQ